VASSLLALLDDIATLLDDVAVLTKVATKKTAGVLGDDLALNAEQVTGVDASRELPVIWAVAKGSAVNKLILVPAALAISAIAPWLMTPLLMIGGGFLCFEGFEKVHHKLFHPKEEKLAEHKVLVEAVANPAVDMVAFEKEKVKGAIRTDFILSAEIVVISLAAMGDAGFGTKVAALSTIAALITVGVYGLVAGIVKLDDAGIALKKKGGASAALGKLLLLGAPKLMKLLSIAGTIAMFLVGGGILVHGIPRLEPAFHAWTEAAAATPSVGFLLGFLVSSLLTGGFGVIAGGLILVVVSTVKKVLPKKAELTREEKLEAAKKVGTAKPS
jgi:predicted DNA repair protein MutK